MKNKILIYFLLIGILIWGLYNQIWNAPFLFDDIPDIVNNPDIKGIGNLKDKLLYPYTNLSFRNRNDPSKPLTYLTFTLNYYFGKLDPFGYHLVDVVLHFIVTILVFLFCKKILSYIVIKKDSTYISMFVSLVFAIHPVNALTVSYVFARSGQLSACFFFLSILFFLNSINKSCYRYLLSLIFFILSIFSKPNTISMPALLIVIDYIFLSNFKVSGLKKRIKYHLIFWIILFLYIGFRYFYLGGIGDVEGGNIRWNRIDYLMIQPYALFIYLKIILFPAASCFEHYVSQNIGNLSFEIIISTLLIILLSLLSWRIINKKNNESKIILFSILYFLITLAPTSSFFPTVNPLVEKRLYLSGIGIFIILAYFIYKILKSSYLNKISKIVKYTIYLSIFVLIFSLGISCYYKNQLFKNPILLWNDVVQRYPGLNGARNNLGRLYLLKNKPRRALHQFQKMIETDKKSGLAYTNIGIIYHKFYKNFDKAIENLNKAIKVAPDLTIAYVNLGLIYIELHKIEKALRYLEKAAIINPSYMSTYKALGDIYFIKKNYKKALKLYKKVIKLNPDNLQVYYAILNIYKIQEKKEKWLQWLKIFRQKCNELKIDIKRKKI